MSGFLIALDGADVFLTGIEASQEYIKWLNGRPIENIRCSRRSVMITIRTKWKEVTK